MLRQFGILLFYCVVELTLPQFYLFLHEMEKAKSVMDYLS